MFILKCKMCGGDIEVSTNKTYGTCDSCGSTVTLPKMVNDVRVNLFNKANRFRQLGDFDQAILAYEAILSKDETDAEAHWCVVLSRYGIEYVQDPISKMRMPTCHRLQKRSILVDPNYIEAIKYANDEYTKELYEKEATKIAKIQKNIIEISQKEAPYDIFICYKENDDLGNRTKDSVLAQEIYYKLKDENYRVFFSRITLEDQLGKEYEPYIFAALNSAKLMLVIGSKPEHFNATWVKNEWSRYLHLMNTDKDKTLIPCYVDMDAYDMPYELAIFQSQNMGKIGFIQDLIYGINKLLKDTLQDKNDSKVFVEPTIEIETLLKRAELFLEDGNFESANDYYEKVLNMEPECARAYVGKLCVEFRIKYIRGLENVSVPISTNTNYKKALRFGDQKTIDFLEYCEQQINRSIDSENKERAYQHAVMLAKKAQNKSDKNKIWYYKQCIEILTSITPYKESEERIKFYQDLLVQTQDEALVNKKKLVRVLGVAGVTLFLGVMGTVGYRYLIALPQQYKEAQQLFAQGEFLESKENFYELGDYKDSHSMWQKAYYEYAVSLLGEEKFETAEQIFSELGTFQDSQEMVSKSKYQHAISLLNKGEILQAQALFNELGSYKKEESNQIKYEKALQFYNEGNYKQARNYFFTTHNYGDTKKYLMELSANTLSMGSYYALGLRDNGTVGFTGWNQYGEGDVSSWNNIVSISANKEHSLGLKADGTVVSTGKNYDSRGNVSGWRDIVQISAGVDHSVGLKVDGTVVTMGNTSWGQSDVENWSDIIQVSAGENYTVGLKLDGTVVTTDKRSDQAEELVKWSNIVQISTGGRHTLGLKSDGTVVSTGKNDYGQSDVAPFKDIIQVSAGRNHTALLKSDGTVIAFGSNDDGRCNVTEWRDIVAIAAGDYHTLGLKSDGTVVIAGLDSYYSYELLSGQETYGNYNMRGLGKIKLPKRSR